MDAAYRKQQTNLFFSGMAVIAFGLWSAVKLVVFMTMYPEQVMEMLNYEEIPGVSLTVVLVLVIVFIVFFSLLLHFYIGMSAIRDARGKKKRRLPYIIVSVLYIVTLIMSCGQSVVNMFHVSDDTQWFSTYVIDMTSIMVLVIIIVSSGKMKKMRKLQEAAGD